LSDTNSKISLAGCIIWLIAILYFFYEFLIRIIPGTIAAELMHDINISPEQFAMVGSAYYLTYGAMQIVVGILVDRFGVRFILFGAAAICTLGVFGFSIANSFGFLFLCRLLIGFGSSFAFVSLLVLAINWFSKKYFGFLAGLSQLLGAIGPLLAGAPVAIAMQKLHGNWRLIFFVLGIFGAALTVIILLFIRNKPAQSHKKVIFINKYEKISKRILSLIKIKQVWSIMLYAGCTYVAMPLLAAFWGTSYLQSRGFPKPSAALLISMIWLGLALGSPLFGRLSDRLKRRKPFLIFCSVLGILSSLLILFAPLNSLVILFIFFIFLGIAGAGQSLSFAIMSENVPDSLKATGLGLNNTAITIFSAVIPPLATVLIQSASHNKVLTQFDFTRGLSLIPIAYVAAFIISTFFIKETFCREQQKIHHLNTSENVLLKKL